MSDSETGFSFGDRVRHPLRPEWGIGAVTRAERRQTKGQDVWRVTARFPGAGLKTLNTSAVQLERVGDDVSDDLPGGVSGEGTPVAGGVFEHDPGDDHWLASVNVKKIEEAMRTLPECVRDPFVSAERRLSETLRLYRFERSNRGLIEWATAQTGLDDPLSRFNRHELENFFDRWSFERDQHLSRTIHEAELSPSELEKTLADAPPAARRALRKVATAR